MEFQEEKKKYKWIFRYLIILFSGCMVYMPMMTRPLANPDTLWAGLHFKYAYYVEKTFGRWGLGLFMKAKGFTISYTFSTLACIMMLAVIVMLICDMFSIDSTPGVVWTSVITIASVHIAEVLTYYYCSDAYVAAYLLNVTAIWMLTKFKRPGFLILSIGMITAAFTLYQSYIGVSIMLCLCFLLYLLILKNEKIRNVLVLAGRYILAGGTGTLLYILLTRSKLLQNRLEYQLNDSRGFSAMGEIDIHRLKAAIGNAYREFFSYFFNNGSINNEFLHRNILNLVLLVMMGIFVCISLICQRRKAKDFLVRVLLVILFFLAQPLGIFCMMIVAPGVGTHGTTWLLMLPAMNLVYLQAFIFIKECSLSLKTAEKIKKIFLYGICAGLAWIMVVYLGIFQDCMENNVNRTSNVARSVVAKLDQMGISNDYRLMMIGAVELGMEENYQIVSGTLAPYGCIWYTNGSLDCWQGVFKEYLGREVRMAQFSELADFVQTEEYLAMPIFPREGSVFVKGDLVIVKISD